MCYCSSSRHQGLVTTRTQADLLAAARRCSVPGVAAVMRVHPSLSLTFPVAGWCPVCVCHSPTFRRLGSQGHAPGSVKGRLQRGSAGAPRSQNEFYHALPALPCSTGESERHAAAANFIGHARAAPNMLRGAGDGGAIVGTWLALPGGAGGCFGTVPSNCGLFLLGSRWLLFFFSLDCWAPWGSASFVLICR